MVVHQHHEPCLGEHPGESLQPTPTA
jgi:hypothetical protein